MIICLPSTKKYYGWSLTFLHGGKHALTEDKRTIACLSRVRQLVRLIADSYRGLLLVWNKSNLHSIHCVKGRYNKNCWDLHLLLKVFLSQCHLGICLRFSVQRTPFVLCGLRVKAPVASYPALLERKPEQQISVMNRDTLSKFNDCKQTWP